MKLLNKYIKSPFNYTGGKHRLLKQILPLFPSDIENMIDLFSGGCNVGINVNAERITFIDYNEKIINLLNMFKSHSLDRIISSIEEVIERYELSNSSRYGYDFYGCNSSEGIGKYNRYKYLKLREDYNNSSSTISIYEKNIMLYVLIVFGFNNQIRFNKTGGFNIPVGKRDFNNKIKSNLIAFIKKIDDEKFIFKSADFKEISLSEYGESFVYADPPYLITNASYNEQDGWTESHEKNLYDLLDELTNNNVQFALSNVLENKGKENLILKQWIEKNKYNVYFMDMNYNNSNYQIKDRTKKTIEVLVTNY